MAKLIKIKLIKSSIGRKPKHKEIVKLLGLGKLNSEVTHNDIPAIRGMLNKISYMIAVEEAK